MLLARFLRVAPFVIHSLRRQQRMLHYLSLGEMICIPIKETLPSNLPNGIENLHDYSERLKALTSYKKLTSCEGYVS